MASPDTLTHNARSVLQRAPRRRRSVAGQGMAEYALILSLIVIGLIIIVMVIGKQTNGMWSNVTNGLANH